VNVLILCAGRGTRLQSVIGNQPKPTIKFGESNLLQRLLRELLPVDSISEIYINVSTGAKQIVKDLQLTHSFPKLCILYESVPWGPSFTVYEALKFSHQGLLVIHGDLLLESGTLGKFATELAIYGEEKSIIAVHERPRFNASQIVRVNNFSLVEEIIWRKKSVSFFERNKDAEHGSVFVDSGIYFFTPSSREVLKAPAFDSGISEGLLPQLFDEKLLKAVLWKGLRFAIDTGEKLEIAKNAFRNYPDKFRIP